MRTLLYYLIFAAILLIIPGCEAGLNSIKVTGTGPVVTQEINLTSFENIELRGVSNFYITAGSPQKVVLKAQQNIIDVLTYEVSNSTLIVGLEKDVSINSSAEIRFEISMPEIKSIDLSGVGDFQLAGAEQSELTVNLTGVGNLRAFDMKVDKCTINLSGVGICEVFVNNELNATLTGVGKVYYKGNPTVNSKVTGVGNVINSNL